MSLEFKDGTVVKNQKRLRIFSALSCTTGAHFMHPTENRFVVFGSRILFSLIIPVSTFSVFGCFYYALQHTNNLAMFTESIIVGIQIVTGVIKLMSLFWNQHRFRTLYNIIINHDIVVNTAVLEEIQPLQIEAQKILDENWNTTMRQVKLFICICIGITGFYFFSAIFSTIYYILNGISDITYAHVFPTAYPFWTECHNDIPYYFIFVIIDSIADYTAGSSAVVFDGLFAIMALHAVALIKILKKMILLMTSEQIGKNSQLPHLKSCIIFHQRIIAFCNDINSLYSWVTLMQFTSSLLQLGISVFVASVGLENDKATLVKMILYLLAAGYELLLYCINGQKIITETEELPNIWYTSKWYDESKEYKDIIYMMIIRDNNPIIFRAYGWISLSLTTFLQIANTSASYFLVLRDMMK